MSSDLPTDLLGPTWPKLVRLALQSRRPEQLRCCCPEASTWAVGTAENISGGSLQSTPRDVLGSGWRTSPAPGITASSIRCQSGGVHPAASVLPPAWTGRRMKATFPQLAANVFPAARRCPGVCLAHGKPSGLVSGPHTPSAAVLLAPSRAWAPCSLGVRAGSVQPAASPGCDDPGTMRPRHAPHLT